MAVLGLKEEIRCDVSYRKGLCSVSPNQKTECFDDNNSKLLFSWCHESDGVKAPKSGPEKDPELAGSVTLLHRLTCMLSCFSNAARNPWNIGLGLIFK